MTGGGGGECEALYCPCLECESLHSSRGSANGDPLRLFCCRLLALVHIVLCVTSEDRKKKMRLHYTSSSDI